MKTGVHPLALRLTCVALALAGAACGGSSGSSIPGTGQDAGVLPPDGSIDRGGFFDASFGTGGSAATGSGGATAGTGGRAGAGTGGSSASSGGTTGAGGAGGAAGCFIRLTPMSPLESGPNMRLRIKATANNPGPRAPVWTWQVQFEDQTQIPTTTITDPAVVEFPIKKPGRYDVQVRVDTGIACPISNEVFTVKAPGNSSFLFRVTPPASAGLGIPAQEQRIELGPTGPSTVDLNLGAGTNVSVRANDITGRYIPAYVRVSGLWSGVTVEGYTASGPLEVLMLPLAAYDVLVVPDGPYAPKLFSTTSAQTSSLEVDQGTYVTGKAMNGAGAPMMGARIVLRSGVRPSTLGVTNEFGEFSLWTRPGILSAVIAPPSDAGLPEANITTGIVVDATATDNRLTMTWATVSRGAVSVAVKTIDGSGPAPAARVRVESETDMPPIVGTLRVENDPLPATMLNATGAVRLEMDADVAGLARFPNLPEGPYKVTVVPPASMTEAALATTHVVLTAAGFTGTVALSRRVMLSGTLLGKGGATGVRVIARDQSTGIAAPLASALSGDRGDYTLSVDPGDPTMDRVYQVVADPPAGTALARTVLGTVPVRAGNKVVPNFTVATAVRFTGTVLGGGRSIGGAVVQVFCLSSACLDPTFPIAETVTRWDGTFTVALPASVQAP